MGASVRPDPVAEYLAAKQKPAGDPVADYLAAKIAAPSGPGVISRGFSKAGEGLWNTIRHPIDTAVGMVTSPIESAANAIAPSVEGADRYNSDETAQARNVARFGGELHTQGVTGRQRALGAIQTAANIAAPGIFSGVRSALGGKALGAAAGLATVGGIGGAAHNPEDPGAGAIAGAIDTPIVGGTIAGVSKAAGKVLDLNSKRLQIKRAPTLGRDAVNRTADIKAVDAQNYGQAEREGAAFSGTTPRALSDELNASDIRPYVDMLLKTRQFANADDATLTREAHKLMSAQQGGIEHRLAANGYDAPLDLENKNIGMAKGALSAGAQQVMPSFPHAVEEHAVRANAAELSQEGADAAKRIMYDRSLPGKKQATQSEEAVLERIGGLKPIDAADYQTGVLGRGKEGMKIHAPNAASSSKLANIVQPITRLNRLAPVIDALDQRQGRGPTTGRKMMNPQTTEQLFRLLGLTLPSELTSP